MNRNTRLSSDDGDPIVAAVRAATEALVAVCAGVFVPGELDAVGDHALLDLTADVAVLSHTVEALHIALADQVQERTVARPREEQITTGSGCRNPQELPRRVTRDSRTTVSRRLKAARAVHRETAMSAGGYAVARYPALRHALAGAELGLDAVLAVAGPLDATGGRALGKRLLRAQRLLTAVATGGLPPRETGDDVDDAEEARLQAEPMGPPADADHIAAMARTWADYVDQDCAEPLERRALRKRGLVIGSPRDGLIPLHGALVPEVAGELQRLFDAQLTPRLDGPSSAVMSRHDAPPEERTNAQLRHDAFAAVLRVAASTAGMAGPPGGGTGKAGTSSTAADGTRATAGQAAEDAHGRMSGDVLERTKASAGTPGPGGRAGEGDSERVSLLGGAAPTLVVTVREKDLLRGRGFAHVEGIDASVSTGAARHVACLGAIQRVVLADNGRIQSLSARSREFTAVQRRAIAVRDGGCVIPSCTVPATWSEIHHVLERSEGGPTHTDNGLMLCWFHHRTLDSGGWDVRIREGVPEVRAPSWWDPGRVWRRSTRSPTRMVERLEHAKPDAALGNVESGAEAGQPEFAGRLEVTGPPGTIARPGAAGSPGVMGQLEVTGQPAPAGRSSPSWRTETSGPGDDGLGSEETHGHRRGRRRAHEPM